MSTNGSQPLRVLLVEDNPADARLVEEMLKDAGPGAVSIVHATRLSSAINSLAQQPFSAVLLDLSLPDSVGLETFTTARDAAEDAPIIVLTGLLDVEMAVRAVREGAQDYLVKGQVDGPLLYQSIRYAIERFRIEDALRTSEARYRNLVEGSIQGILIHVDGTIRLANPALARLFQVSSADSLIGTSIWSYIDPRDRQRVESDASARVQGKEMPDRYEMRVIRTSGRVIWLDCIATMIDWDGERAILATVVDITERKEAEEALRASEERFRQLAENVKEAFLVVALPSYTTLYVSPVWEEIWGRRVTELEANPRIWFESVHPDDQSSVQIEQAALAEGQAVTSVFRVIRPDGGTRWVRARLFPVFDGAGLVYRMVGLTEDITELRRTEEQFRQAQRMEAVGRLAGGIAHDFNNLLTAILGYTELILGDIGPNHPVSADVTEIQNAGQSAVRLTRQLLAFSRKQILQPRVIDLGHVIERMDSLLKRLIGEDVSLTTRLAPVLRSVNADPGQIEQVVMNLAVNARDAMPDGGNLTIETSNVDLDELYTARHPGTSVGPHVMLAVSDSGVGMSEETQRRLFEPFFTTKEAGKGTGLGLATVYGIVKQSQGSIWVYSEPGHGSTFKIYLPAAVRGKTVEVDDTAQARPLNGTETVLVVEDQSEVRAVIRTTLHRHGYTVLEASSGPDALAISREHADSIQLLFTDVVMPGLSGRRVAQILTSERPGLRVLYTSGYTDDAIVQHGVLEPGLAFLQKPYSSYALLRKVRDVLDSSDAPAV